MKANASPISSVLGKTDALSRLSDHAARLMRLQNTVNSVLPRNMHGAVGVANLQDGILSLHANSPALATRLKQSTPSLISTLQVAGEVVSQIKIRVRTRQELGLPEPSTTPRRHIPEHGRQALRELQLSLKADSPLARALKTIVDKSA